MGKRGGLFLITVWARPGTHGIGGKMEGRYYVRFFRRGIIRIVVSWKCFEKFADRFTRFADILGCDERERFWATRAIMPFVE